VSNDGGNTLRESNYGFTNRNFTTLTGAGANLYSSSVYEPVSGGVYRSDNLGLRWNHQGEPPAEPLLLMAAAPDNPKILFGAGYRALLESQDAGKTWAPYKNQPPGTKITAILPVSATTLFVGTDRGLFRSGEGAAWTSLAPARVDSISRSGGKILLALTGAGALHSADAGETWTRQKSGTEATLYHVDFRNEKQGWAVGERGTILRTEDGGNSWTKVESPARATLLSVQFVNEDEGWIAGRSGVILRSSNRGQTWIEQESGTKQNLYALFIDKKNGWAVGSNGLIVKYQR